MKKKIYTLGSCGMLLACLCSLQPHSRAQGLAYTNHAQVMPGKLPAAAAVSVKDALDNLRKHYKVDILFSDQAVRGLTVPGNTIKLNQPLEQNLDALLKSFNLNYRRSKEGTYLVTPSAKIGESTVPSSSAITGTAESMARQVDQRISGRVTDDKGEGMPGVTVQLKGTTIATSTGTEGNYSLTVPDGNGTLVFSFIGFQVREIPINNSTTVNAVLNTDAEALDEVVVVGYGTQKKANVTGAVVSISSEKIQERSNSNVMQSLSGQLPGVNISQSQGAPGFSPSIRVRGITSITAGTSPLYVVDGFPMEQADLNIINPLDIESVEILKDASSAAIYGSRGANGVVLITTKSGKEGKTKVSFSYEKGIQQAHRQVEMMDAQEFMRYFVDAHNNAWIKAGGKASDPNSARPQQYRIPPEFISNPEKFGQGTDWQDVLFRSAPMDNYQISLSGGNAKTKFLVSGGYLKQSGLVESNEYERVSFRSNVSHDISDKVKIGTNITLAKIDDQSYGTGGKSDVVSLAIQNDPIFPVFNENGNYGFRDPNSEWYRFTPYSVQLWHPYAITREIDRLQKRFNVLGTAFVEYNVFKSLKFRSSLSTNVNYSRFNEYRNMGQKYGWSAYQPAQGIANSDMSLNWLTENTLAYDKTFGDHSVTGLLGYSAQKQDYEQSTLTSGNFPNDIVQTLNAGTPINGGSTASEWSLISYIARANYSYKDKYLLTATLRRDGSSRFGSNSKWGYFPSASVGWRISEEGFFASQHFINELKVRASYGVTGNNLIPNYGAIGLLGSTRYVAGTDVVNGLYTSTIPNPDLKWEKTGQLNVGFDLGLLSNRINVEFDFYNSVTRDLLLDIPVPVITGFSTQLTNIGKVQNRGVELLISTKNLTGDKLQWSTDFNISANRNKVLKLGPNNAPIILSQDNGVVKTEVGQPIANYYGYIFDGVFMNKEEVGSYPHHPSTEPGDPRIRDVNGDGSINEDDRTTIGNYQPDFTAGLTNTFKFKGFDLSFMLHGSYGGEIMNLQTRFSKFYNGGRNAYKSVANYWRSPEEPGDGEIFKPSIAYTGLQTAFSSFWVEDGSFLRLKFIRLGYNIPQKLLKRTPISTGRIYFNVENALILTKYSGYDPESSVYSEGMRLGMDYGAYPVPRSFTFGVRAEF